MTRVYVVTGSASGIGRAVVDRLHEAGHRTIGVDLHDATITADLATPAGRHAMVEAVHELAPGGIDGVLASAGLEKPDKQRETLAVNYFGAVATFEGLRPLLARSDRARAVALASTAALYAGDEEVMARCLDGDEAAALELVQQRTGVAYVSSKVALCRWVRRAAVQAEWGGAGIALNAIAPGVVHTPMTAPRLSDPVLREEVARISPTATGQYAQPGEIAELVCFLLSCASAYLLGQTIFMDGGADAFVRPGHI